LFIEGTKVGDIDGENVSMVAKLGLEFFVVETGILADEVVNKVFKIGLEMAVSTFDGVFGI